MKKQNFLNELKEKGKLELVEASEDICASYLITSPRKGF